MLKMKAPLDFAPPHDDWLLDDLHRHPSMHARAHAHANITALHHLALLFLSLESHACKSILRDIVCIVHASCVAWDLACYRLY